MLVLSTLTCAFSSSLYWSFKLSDLPNESAKTGGKTKSYHHGDLKEALLKASLELVNEKGPHGFTLAEVCRKAGVSVAAPYRHYRDKEALLAAIATAGFERQYQCLTAAVENAENKTFAALIGCGVAYIDFAREHPARYKVMFASELSKSKFPELYATARRAFDVVFCTVEKCLIESGRSTANTYVLSVLVWSHCHGIATLGVDGFLREIAMEEQIKKLVELATKSFVQKLLAEPSAK
jgi:AcrR family transcriptional regulator